MDMLNFMPEVSQSSVVRWDREWMNYFATEEMSVHLIESKYLKVVGKIEQLEPAEVFQTSLCSTGDGSLLPALYVWLHGSHLVGKDILEIGCGCGFFGKQIGLVARSYLGLDLSNLALAIARGNSPGNCSYLHLGRQDEIASYASSRDVVVGREFFIHQNFENATWVLRLGTFLLRPGGIIAADFYHGDPAIPQGVVHPAKSPLDKEYASCAFEFTETEVSDLAGLAGLEVVDIHDYKPHQRRFVTFRKPGKVE